MSEPDMARCALRREEAARVLAVGLTTFDVLIRDGRLPAVKMGRRVLIPVEAIDALLADGVQQ